MDSVVQLYSEGSPDSHSRLHRNASDATRPGLLIVNADDWGRDCETTDRILECTLRGAVSSVSAMVFMEDSDRAATLAREHGIDAGLHLNFTTSLSAPAVPPRLLERLGQVAHYLRRHRLAGAVFNPALVRSFEYLVAVQIDEYHRIYGRDAERLDGHHHMHLCANVLLQRLLPRGTIVRRNFTFEAGEKGLCNRTYRKAVDRSLARRHRLRDFFFSLPPLDSGRLKRIYSLAQRFVVEVETHPVQPNEYRYLAGGEIFKQIGGVPIASRKALASCKSGLN